MSALLALAIVMAQMDTQQVSALEATASAVSERSVARGATRVPLLNVHLQASCDQSGPVIVQSMVVRQVGLGASSDLLGAYILEDGVRLSRRQSIEPRSRQATVRLRLLSLKPCEEKTLQVAVDVSPDAVASGEHGLVLESVTGRTLDGVLAATIRSDGAQPASRIAPVTDEAPTFTLRDLPGRITYGPGRRVARFLLTAGDDDILVTAITFENAGKARDRDLQNLRITNASGDTLTAVLASLDGDRARLVFVKPLLLERNDQRLLELRADVRASVRKTVQFELAEPSDIEWESASR